MHGLWATYKELGEELVFQSSSFQECHDFAQAYPKDTVERLVCRHANGQRFVLFSQDWLKPHVTRGETYAESILRKAQAKVEKPHKQEPVRFKKGGDRWLAKAHQKDPHCRACGIKTTLPVLIDFLPPSERFRKMATKDHIIPRSKGGENHTSNYQLLCQPCNLEKSNRLDFKLRIRYPKNKEHQE